MKAIILAAGRGSRMNVLTANKPKCLMKLDGKTLLEWQLGALRQAGLNDIVVMGGYKKELLEHKDYFTLENPRWADTNMVGTLLYAREFLSSEECLISYADIVYHPEHVQALKERKEDIIILYDKIWKDLWQTRFENPLEDAESFRIDDMDRILEIGRKTSLLSDIQGQYMGLLKFTPNGWKQIDTIIRNLSDEQQDRIDMTSLLQLLIEANISVYAEGIHGQWVEADNANDLEMYEQKLTTISWGHDWRW